MLFLMINALYLLVALSQGCANCAIQPFLRFRDGVLSSSVAQIFTEWFWYISCRPYYHCIYIYIYIYIYTYTYTHSKNGFKFYGCHGTDGAEQKSEISCPLTAVAMRAPTCDSENMWVDDYIVSTNMVLSLCLQKSQVLQNGAFFLKDCTRVCYMRRSKAVKLAVPLDLVLNTLHYGIWGFENTSRSAESYVYWTVHHLDSWVKRDKLDATCFIVTLFSAQHVSGVNTSILSSVRLIRWVTSWGVSGSKCVGVTLQCGYGGVVSVCRLKHSETCWALNKVIKQVAWSLSLFTQRSA